MGTAEARRLAEEVVRQATASSGGETRTRTTSSYGEFRSRAAMRVSLADSQEHTFWKYLTAPPVLFGQRPEEPDWAPARYLIEPGEHRTLSRATGPAGGFLVPQDFDELVTSARRARNVIGNTARVVLTDHGRPIPLPTATAHGTGAWTAENAAVTASDDTFAQVTVNAFKGTTKTIVSEELALDALEDFDAYLGDELGQRLALLEETAFATGDGAGKPRRHYSFHERRGDRRGGNRKRDRLQARGRARRLGRAPGRVQAERELAHVDDRVREPREPGRHGGLVLPSLHAAEPTLYGRVYQSPELPAAAANARSVVVGDLQAGYAVRRVRGYGVQRQTELHSDSGQIGYRLFTRVDGRVVITDALRILTNSAT